MAWHGATATLAGQGSLGQDGVAQALAADVLLTAAEGWHKVEIVGATIAEREARARAHAQQFQAAHRAFEGGDDAFMVQSWSPAALNLYFSPGAIAMGHGLFQSAGARPCRAPVRDDSHFFAGSSPARAAWGQGPQNRPRAWA